MILSGLLLCGGAGIAQQQIPNSSFEYWENSGESTEPKGWNSLMSADMCTFCRLGASQRVYKEKRGLPGKGSCIRIESTSAIGGVIVNGSVTTGQVTAPTIRPSDGYNRTVIGNQAFSLRHTEKPDSLVFWAKYSITDGSDSALASFILHANSAMTDPPKFARNAQPVAVARQVFQTGRKWVRVSLPFDYMDNFNQKAIYLLATFSSSFKAGEGNANATLWVDEVELIYNRLTDIPQSRPALVRN